MILSRLFGYDDGNGKIILESLKDIHIKESKKIMK
jgi:hypothetical protein